MGKEYTLFQELISEFIGTLILIMFGCGVVAATVLFEINGVNGSLAGGGITDIHIAWGLAVTFGIYASYISGAHINPAVTLALAVTGRFPWKKVVPFSLAQTAGAFAGALLVFAVYHTKWFLVDPELLNTASIFSTFPATKGILSGLVDQVVGTAILMYLILATGDKLAAEKVSFLGPIVVGLIVVAIGMSFGMMHGYAINPARDLGPRLFSVLAGFKNNGLTDGSGVWLIPIVGPLVGAPVGALLYDKVMGKIISK